MAKNLRSAIDHGWRLLATAISFSVFGIGGVLLGLVVFPLLSFLPGDTKTRVRRSQYVLHLSFYAFIGLMHRLGIMTYDIEGLEKLNRARQLIVANHPTLIDIVFLISRIKYASCIVKASLLRNPAMRGAILNGGFISNADSETMIDQCASRLDHGGCLIIFPEGTRTRPGQASRFQRGAAVIALQADCVLTPVTLDCKPSTLTKDKAWYQIPRHPFHLTMRVGDDIPLNRYRALEPRSIAARRLTHDLQNYFSQRKEHHERSGN